VRRNTADPRTAIHADTQGLGRHRRASSRMRKLVGGRRASLAPVASQGYGVSPPPPAQRSWWKKHARMIAAVTAAMAVAVTLIIGLYGRFEGGRPLVPRTYLGVYTAGLPESYAGVSAFTAATGVRPGLVMYYSGWLERFQGEFAREAARHGAVPLVQIEPTGISLAAIAAGRYDTYLRSYAASVKAFGGPVILSFGHEMNGYWYSWGYRHTSPTTFVAAWRHVVTVFRQQGAGNVTWLWTVNVIDTHGGIPPPARWWPGGSYVNLVGLDGYYLRPSWTFASLFGPTIKAIRALTLDKIFISETGAPNGRGQPAKVTDLFAGIRAYGLLGFVWFDTVARHELPRNGIRDWRLGGAAAFAAFRSGARAYRRPP
jgi:mannan endo-1,4-beta-mannosidase